MVKTVERPRLTFWQRLALPEIGKGLALTLRRALGFMFQPKKAMILDYPEVQPVIRRDHRSRHRLMKRPDGSPRCVACFMCSTACPARCIRIVAEASEDPRIEKRPKSFEIDLLLCVYCGMCVEACPCDAIRMDTGIAVNANDARRKFLIAKEALMDWEPKDYPEDDAVSQQAPGGTKNAEAMARWQAGGGAHGPGGHGDAVRASGKEGA